MTIHDARDRYEGWLEIVQYFQQYIQTSPDLAQDQEEEDGDDDGSDPEMESLESAQVYVLSFLVKALYPPPETLSRPRGP